MNIIKKMTGLFSVMEDEVRSFRLLFLQSLFIGFANSYYYIVSSSFLIKNVSIKNLPTAYIVTGTAGFLLIQLYKNTQKKYGIARSYRMAIIIFTVVCAFNFFAMFELADNRNFAIFLAYFTVLFAAPFTTIFSLGLFAQCSRIYNMAQSKRLLALIISGEIISSIIAYMSMPAMGLFIKSHIYVLLPVAGVFAMLIFIPFNKLAGITGEKFKLPNLKKDVKLDFTFFRKDKFYTLIAVATLFSVFAIYVVDYAYLISVRYMAKLNNLEIAQIVSVFFFAVKVGELTFSFASGKILSNKGVKFSLLLLPAILLLFSALAFLFGFLFHGTPIFLLAFLFLGKLTERAIRKAITTPSVKVMYQVAEPHERLEIEASIDGLLSQVATVVSGVVLLVISFIFFGHNDMFNLLHLFSFVCIVAFALWSFFSFRMYESYRHKIKDFLLKVKTSIHPGKVVVPASDLQEDAVLSDDNNVRLVDRVHIAISAVHNVKKEELLDLIKIYNPKQSLDFRNEHEDTVSKKLVHVYYSNTFYFSRLLILRYINHFQSEVAFTFLKELWDVSDITCRLELIISFNEREHKHVDPTFFERQAEQCVKEIVWLDAALYDVESLKNEDLDAELDHHRSMQVALLFQLLRPIYEPGVMQVIYDIVTKNKGDIENQLFALELLDITLTPTLKEMIKPVLEPISFENKKQKLNKLFHIYHYTPKDRLVDILMKDYNLISLRLKELALIAYNRVTEEKHVLSAFRTNSIDNLKYRADEMFSGYQDPFFQAKMEVLKTVEYNYSTLKTMGPYLINYAIFVPRQRNNANEWLHKMSATQPYLVEMRLSSNVPVKLDSLALALLVTLKQRQLDHHDHAMAEA